MEEAAQADYVVIIDDGAVAAKGTPAEIRHRHSSDTLKMTVSEPEALRGILAELHIRICLVGKYLYGQASKHGRFAGYPRPLQRVSDAH